MAIGIGTDNNMIPISYKTDSDGVNYPYVLEVKQNQDWLFPMRKSSSCFGEKNYVTSSFSRGYLTGLPAASMSKTKPLTYAGLIASSKVKTNYPYITVAPTIVPSYYIYWYASPAGGVYPATSSPVSSINTSFFRVDDWKVSSGSPATTTWNVYSWMLLAIENYNSIDSVSFTAAYYELGGWSESTSTASNLQSKKVGSATIGGIKLDYVLVKTRDTINSLVTRSECPSIISAPEVTVICGSPVYSTGGNSTVAIIGWGVDAGILSWTKK